MTCRARAVARVEGCVPAEVAIASDSRNVSKAAGRITGASVAALLMTCKGAAPPPALPLVLEERQDLRPINRRREAWPAGLGLDRSTARK